MSESQIAKNQRRRQAGGALLVLRVLSVLLYSAVFVAVYRSVVAPVYRYSGLTYRSVETGDLVVTALLVGVVGMLLPQEIRRVSHFIQWVLGIVVTIPSILLAQYSTTLPPAEATKLGLALTLGTLTIRAVAASRPRRTLSPIIIPPGMFWMFVAFVDLAVTAALVGTVGLDVAYLAFDDVYSVRADFKTQLAAVPLLAYLLPLAYAVANPLLMARGIYARQPLVFTAGALGQVVIYLCTGHKVVILSIATVVGLAFLFRRSHDVLAPHRLVGWTVVGLLASVAVDRVLGRMALVPITVVRLIAIPGALTSAYVLVFSQNPKMLFSSFLPGVDSPYTSPPFKLVGAMFFNDPGNSANANLFGDGFLQYGYVGMLIEAAVLGVLLWCADDLTDTIALPAACMIFIMPTIALTNGSVFTVILTHGFGAALVACALLPRQPILPEGTGAAAPERALDRA